MELEIINEKLLKMNRDIKEVLKDSAILDDGEMNLEYDRNDPEQNFLAGMVWGMFKHLDSVHGTMEYLQQPVAYEGVIHKNQNGRYEVDGIELTCGSSLEVLVYDEIEEANSWVASRIEADGDYYLVAKPRLDLEGLKGRIRRGNRW